MAGMSADPGPNQQCPQTSQNVSATHPHGVTGTFLIGQTYQRLSYHLQEVVIYGCPGFNEITPGNSPQWHMKKASIMSVSRKTLSAPSLASQQWNFYTSMILARCIGHTFSQTYTARQQPLRTRTFKSGVTALDQTYSYDAVGRILGVSDAADSSNSRSYGYDDLGRLTSASGPWGNGSYVYDPLGNLRAKTLGSRAVTLGYDASRNRMNQIADTGGSGMASTGTRTVAYDSRGNVTALGNLNFLYNTADQPRAITGSSNGTYRYDGNLRRVKSIVDSKTIYNVFDLSGALVHVEKLSGGGQSASKTDYVPGPSGTLARITNNAVTYLHNDPVGSASSGTNASGGKVWTERYTPFGEALLKPSANDDLGGYTGHIRDDATGLNYMQARFQDPVSGRFLSIDPVTFLQNGNPGYFNRYAYTMNDPINLIDPDGRESWLVSRPLSPPAGIAANHMFVLVRNDTTGQVSRFSYGPQGHPTKSPGKLVNHAGTGTKTDTDDAAFAGAFLADRKNAESFGVTASPINASDTDVIAAGNAVNEMLGTPQNPGEGAPNYNILPDNAGAASRGDLQANSNSAATAVANIASGSQSQSMPPGSVNPGANDQWVISTCKSVNDGGASSSC